MGNLWNNQPLIVVWKQRKIEEESQMSLNTKNAIHIWNTSREALSYLKIYYFPLLQNRIHILLHSSLEQKNSLTLSMQKCRTAQNKSPV